MDKFFDVYVYMPDDKDPDGYIVLYVSTVLRATDQGLIVDALHVLFPLNVGCSIEPAKAEEEDATK